MCIFVDDFSTVRNLVGKRRLLGIQDRPEPAYVLGKKAGLRRINHMSCVPRLGCIGLLVAYGPQT